MNITYSRELEIRYNCDVFVAGGGPSGFAAALAASRCGKKVILAEQSGSVGGASVLAKVSELMNFDDGKNFLTCGIGREIHDRLFGECAFKREWYNVRVEDLKLLYDELLCEAGVEILFYNRVIDAVVEENKIKYVILSGPDGSCALCSQTFIDATGCGMLSMFAGANYSHGDENGNTMSTTVCSLWAGVDFDKKGIDGDNYEKAYEDGVFSQYDPILPGIKKNYPEVGVGGGNVGHCFGVDDRNTKSITDAMIKGRKQLREYEKYYREYVPGCENATLIGSADFLGVRESRRIDCEYNLSMDDFYSESSFDDEIGRYSYPVDIHPMSADKDGMDNFYKAISLRHKSGESYSIPYRCLVPKGVDNLWVTGRCVGSDRAMQASVRVIPGCYITGQAAGCGAAVCVEDKTTAAQADIKKIKAKLAMLAVGRLSEHVSEL